MAEEWLLCNVETDEHAPRCSDACTHLPYPPSCEDNVSHGSMKKGGVSS